MYRYRDFVLEASIAADRSNGHSSAGFLFRRADDLNYYFMLVSPAGHFRFDVVFNGNPRTLIAWTDCPSYSDVIRLRIIARGQYFGFFLDEEWVAELEDDTIDAGNIAFAAQNYDENDRAHYDLINLKVHSIPYEVEAQYYRWRRYVPVDPARRLVLARSLASHGSFHAACIQFNLAAKEMELGVQDLLTSAECYLHTGLIEEAAKSVDKAVAAEKHNKTAIAAKADLLYRQNRILELRDFLSANPEVLEDNAIMWNLYGNAWYALGNCEEAVQAYKQACEIDGEVSVYRINAARALEKLQDTKNALDYYLAAARILFREENYAELSGVLPRIEKLDTGNREVIAIRGKLAFGEGRFDEAGTDLEKAIRSGSNDSSVHYLYGILLVQTGEREEAAIHFSQATALEPDYYLYWFRRAENEHMLRHDAEGSIRRALELSPEDKWVLNLAGLIALEHGRDAEALKLLEKAYAQIADSEDADILINYSEALCRNGEEQKAISLLAPMKENAAVVNQLGNILSHQGDFENAVNAYERAIRLSPEERDFHLNCAAACIEADRVLRAEEILAHLLDGSEDEIAYNLIGNAAQIKGELKRAEAAYTHALKSAPGYEEAAVNLADLQCRTGKYEEAAETIDAYLSSNCTPRVKSLQEKVKEETEAVLVCAVCGKKWTTKTKVEVQPKLTIRGELPDDAPAGMCAACGKVYCVGCAKAELRDGRFHCPSCKEPLKLLTDHLKLIVSRYAE